MTSHNMKRALALARRGLGRTSPNPMVGAVIVDDSGQIIAEGYHRKAGGAHAEAEAISKAGPRARGKALYVTLEPCNHTGRTPPCTQAIIAAGIRHVTIAMPDPNPEVVGGGIDLLMRAGITVSVGDGAEEAEQLNHAFATWSRAHRPWVTLKAAMTLDGKVASQNGESKYLTSSPALLHAHELRRTHDAILVGSGTVLADNPELTYRGKRRGRDPVRVVLDSSGRSPAGARVFQSESDSPSLVFTTDSAPVEWERDIFSAGGEVIRVARGQDGHVSVPAVLNELADRRILSVLVEGGPTVHASFILHQLADRWVGYVAPLLLGGATAPTAVAGEGLNLAEARRLHVDTVRRMGPDVIIDATFAPARNASLREPGKEQPHVYGSH